MGQKRLGSRPVSLLIPSHSRVVGTGRIVGKAADQTIENIQSLVVLVSLEVHETESIEEYGIVGRFAYRLAGEFHGFIQSVAGLGQKVREIVHRNRILGLRGQRFPGYLLGFLGAILHLEQERQQSPGPWILGLERGGLLQSQDGIVDVALE